MVIQDVELSGLVGGLVVGLVGITLVGRIISDNGLALAQFGIGPRGVGSDHSVERVPELGDVVLLGPVGQGRALGVDHHPGVNGGITHVARLATHDPESAELLGIDEHRLIEPVGMSLGDGLVAMLGGLLLVPHIHVPRLAIRDGDGFHLRAGHVLRAIGDVRRVGPGDHAQVEHESRIGAVATRHVGGLADRGLGRRGARGDRGRRHIRQGSGILGLAALLGGGGGSGGNGIVLIGHKILPLSWVIFNLRSTRRANDANC